MAKCAKCGSETGLFSRGVPVCFECAALRITRRPNVRVTLSEELVSATKRNSEAIRKFEEATAQYLGGSHDPDTQRLIDNAANMVSLAREEMASAHGTAEGRVPPDVLRRAHRSVNRQPLHQKFRALIDCVFEVTRRGGANFEFAKS